MKYRTIVADPPWAQGTVGRWALPKHSARDSLPYEVMPITDIKALPIADLAEDGCHLWLWTTNRHLEEAFGVMRAWGFMYLTTITWVKPSGMGAYFASTTQHCLFGYFQHCRFERRRFAPTHFLASPKRHSEKPEAFTDLIESISEEPRLELFARRQRIGWDTWGNECRCDVEMVPS